MTKHHKLFDFIVLLELAAFGVTFVAEVWLLVRPQPDWMTAVMVLAVLVVWVVGRGSLLGWQRRNPWLYDDVWQTDDPGPSIQIVTEAVAATWFDHDGARCRSASSLDIAGPNGAATEHLRPLDWLSSLHTLLISIGLFGTFLGLTYGLSQAVPKLQGRANNIVVAPAPAVAEPTPDTDHIEGMQAGMNDLLDGASLAFAKSMAGILFGTLWMLRLRSVEARRDGQLRALSEHLDGQARYKSTAQILADQLAAIQATRALVERAREAEATAQAQHDRRNSALRDDNKAIIALWASHHAQTNARAMEHFQAMKGLGELIVSRVDLTNDALGELSESLPTQIGSKTGDQLAQLLAPQFTKIVEELQKVTDGASTKIGEAMLQQADAEVSELQRALTSVVAALDRIPQDYQARMGEVQTGLEGAFGAAGATVTSASMNLGQVSGHLRATLDEIARLLPEVSATAAAMATAGEQVREGLAGVATPLTTIPGLLDTSAAAIAGTNDALGAAEAALREQGEAVARNTAGVQGQLEAISAVAGQSAGLADRLGRLNDVTERASAQIESSTGAQASASTATLHEMAAALASFRERLSEAQSAIAQGSTEATQSARDRADDATEGFTRAMAQSTAAMERSLKRTTEIASQLERAMASARESSEAMHGHAEALRNGIVDLVAPMTPVTAALQEVHDSVHGAAMAVRAENQTLKGMGLELRERAEALRNERAALDQSIQAQNAARDLLVQGINGHLGSLLKANQAVKEAWAHAIEQSKAATERNSEQLAKYAEHVEKSLRTPMIIRQLDGTVGDLDRTLQQLNQVLAQLRDTGALESGAKAAEHRSNGE